MAVNFHLPPIMIASLMGRLLLIALSHWRRSVAILGAAAITPMIHSRCFARTRVTGASVSYFFTC